MIEIRIIKGETLVKEYHVQECCVDYEKKKVICKSFEFHQFAYESIDSGYFRNGMPYYKVYLKDE